MPAKTNTPTNGTPDAVAGNTKSNRKYNPTITAFFDAPKFSMKGEDGSPIEGTAFISTNIDSKAFEIIQKHVSVSTKLLLRQAVRLNKNGGRTFYLEVLPPMADNAGYKGNPGRNYKGNASANSEDDI